MSQNVLLEIAELQDKTVAIGPALRTSLRRRMPKPQQAVLDPSHRVAASSKRRRRAVQSSAEEGEELAIGAETRVTAPRKNSTEGVKLVLPEPDSFVDWDPRLPPPGNIVERQYKGKMIRVIVLQEGFEYEGRRYKSLTAIAKEVSGSHCNGFLFFRLGRRA